jgi:hypothetical protein
MSSESQPHMSPAFCTECNYRLSKKQVLNAGLMLGFLSCSEYEGDVFIPNITIANRSFENVSQFRYLGTTVTNLIQEEITRRMNAGNSC